MITLHLYRAADHSGPLPVHLIDTDRVTTEIPAGARFRLVDGRPGSFYLGATPGTQVGRVLALQLGDQVTAPTFALD